MPTDDIRTWSPGCLPPGFAIPSGQPYSILASMPTWQSIKLYLDEDGDFFKTLQWAYPRGMLTAPVRTLRENIFSRLSISDRQVNCVMFPTSRACLQCMVALRQEWPAEDIEACTMVRFSIPTAEENQWSGFWALLYPSGVEKDIMAFWRDSGKVLSPRHAQYCSDILRYMGTESAVEAYNSPASEALEGSVSAVSILPESTGKEDSHEVRSFIAELIASDKPGHTKIDPANVFLYPTGMTAIYTLSQSLVLLVAEPVVVTFGWMYVEIVDLLQRKSSGWAKVLAFRETTEDALDALEDLLVSGQRIHALFCELPSSVKLESPNLQRIHALAEVYGFIVACDETMGNFVNVDILPYVDVAMSSLTKLFNGAADVMGGSLVLNPQSKHHNRILSAVKHYHEDIYFPIDLSTLRKNSKDIRDRVRRSNTTTLSILPLLRSHPAVSQLFFPSLLSSSKNYEKCKRCRGGYGNTIVVIFKTAEGAAAFYDRLGCYKSASFGTNFTMAVPYGELTYSAWDEGMCERYGLPKHMIRLNVGLEDENIVRRWIGDALRGVDEMGDREM